MVSAPYIICTPKIGNSVDGCYFVKFGDTKNGGKRIKDYDTYLPEPNRTSSQFQESDGYKIDGDMLENQIFKASNTSLQPTRHKFTQVGSTEWYQVWPKDSNKKLHWAPLAAVLTSFLDTDRQAQAKEDMPQNHVHPFIDWLNKQIPNEWATKN
ncbi:hypothetical protein MD484_g6572, partial [Candolleomyces efflorescens]